MSGAKYNPNGCPRDKRLWLVSDDQVFYRLDADVTYEARPVRRQTADLEVAIDVHACMESGILGESLQHFGHPRPIPGRINRMLNREVPSAQRIAPYRRKPTPAGCSAMKPAMDLKAGSYDLGVILAFARMGRRHQTERDQQAARQSGSPKEHAMNAPPRITAHRT
jgi:hypothetical protein